MEGPPLLSISDNLEQDTVGSYYRRYGELVAGFRPIGNSNSYEDAGDVGDEDDKGVGDDDSREKGDEESDEDYFDTSGKPSSLDILEKDLF